MVRRCAACRRRALRRKVRLWAAAFFFWRWILRRRRRWWVGPDLKMRETKGEYHLLVNDIRQQREEKFKTHFRMSPETFNKLLGLVKVSIEKVTTSMRKPISAQERLAVTLQFLAHGGSYESIAIRYKMSKAIVSKIIPETCDAIWAALKPMVMPAPTKNMWKNISEDFERKYQFPNCLGAIDGKHIQIKAPTNSRSLFCNYKKTFSIVLLVAVDANCKFVTVDVGAYSRSADGRILAQSKFGAELLTGQLDLPEDQILPGQSKPVPPVFVADEAFPLKRNLLRPFSGSSLDNQARRVFNYRLSRARRTVDMAFGNMFSRFKVLYGRMNLSPDRAGRIVRACTVLHNFLSDENLDDGEPTGDESSSNIMALQRIGRQSCVMLQKFVKLISAISIAQKAAWIGSGVKPAKCNSITKQLS